MPHGSIVRFAQGQNLDSHHVTGAIVMQQSELAVIEAIARSGNDGPVLMLNLSRYKAGSGFPGDGIHGV